MEIQSIAQNLIKENTKTKNLVQAISDNPTFLSIASNLHASLSAVTPTYKGEGKEIDLLKNKEDEIEDSLSYGNEEDLKEIIKIFIAKINNRR